MRIFLGKQAIAGIHKAIDTLFEKARVRFLGPGFSFGPKTIAFHTKPDLSLPGLFQHASRLNGFEPNQKLEESVLNTAKGYLDAHQQLAKTKVVHAVQSFLNNAELKKVKTNVETVLGGELIQVMGKVTQDVKKIFMTEPTRAINAGSIDAISKIAGITNTDDPLVYFVVVRDNTLCPECKRLHLMEDGVTPRVWKLSEVNTGYHKKGEESPSMSGLHPHCRCRIASVVTGFGFKNGKISYISPGFNAWEAQRNG